jgi:bifunctional enzyme CysN/CysC
VSGLLRFATAGSVDDGKSTLIGRLLYDSKSVFQDQLESVERTSADRGDDYTNLALLTDGLRAEREQGITIDVAYRYFSTPARSFIVADTPGHVQYTRNMVTGASTADLALVLVDARKGVLSQTRRHASLSALLRVPHLVLAVNKMDLVDWDRAVFDRIVADFAAFAEHLDLPDVTAIPMAALSGDNVVDRSDNTPWYDGPTLLHHLETVPVDRGGAAARGARFPVQYVIRPMSVELPDYRGYAGTLASGRLAPGDEVVVLPSGRRSTVASIDVFEGSLPEAVAGQAVTVRLADEVDVSRGDMLVAADDLPTVASSFEATVCWMTEEPLRPGQRLLLKHTTRTVKAMVQDLHDRLDVESLTRSPAAQLDLNDIGRLTLKVAQPVFTDDYVVDRRTGAFVLVDEATGNTVGAGMVGSTLGLEVEPAPA